MKELEDAARAVGGVALFCGAVVAALALLGLTIIVVVGLADFVLDTVSSF